MGKRLQLRVIAEGVEKESQLEFLRRCGCDEYQGYLFAKPVTATEMSAMLKSHRAAA
jgi:EAL domain-containing protein (putative c-di-GMP-specific phosphodiesterase class I)